MRFTSALCFCGLFLIACADEEPVILPNPCNAEACDIREADCQAAVMDVVRCFRGGDGGLPPVEVVSEDEYRDIWNAAGADEDDAGASDDADDDGGAPELDGDERFERVMHGLSLIELAPEDIEISEATDEFIDNVNAQYQVSTDRILIVDRGEALDSEGVVATLAHELVHAMQHREHDIPALLEDIHTTDARLALEALVEGEATHFDILVSAALVGVWPSSIDWDSLYIGWQRDTLRAAYEDEYPVPMASIRFPYAFGGYYVTSLRLWYGPLAVDDRFETPPRSTADVLTRPVLVEEELAQALALEEQAVPVAAEGFYPIAVDELGSFIYDGFLHRVGLTTREGIVGDAIDLIADRVSVFYDASNDHTVLAWRLRHMIEAEPSAEDVGRFREALDAPDEDAPEPDADVRARVWRDGRDLMLIIGDHALDAAWLVDDLEWVPAPEPMPMQDTMSERVARMRASIAR